MPVSLQNLLKTGQLKEHPPDAAEVQRLLQDVVAWLKAHRPHLIGAQR